MRHGLFCGLITVKSCSTGYWYFTVLFLYKLMYKSRNETLYVFDIACLEVCTPDLFKHTETFVLNINLLFFSWKCDVQKKKKKSQVWVNSGKLSHFWACSLRHQSPKKAMPHPHPHPQQFQTNQIICCIVILLGKQHGILWKFNNVGSSKTTWPNLPSDPLYLTYLSLYTLLINSTYLYL